MYSDLYLTPNRYREYKIKYCWINSVKASNTMQPNWNDRFWPPTQSAGQKSYNWTLVQDRRIQLPMQCTGGPAAILRVVAGSVGMFWTMCSVRLFINCQLKWLKSLMFLSDLYFTQTHASICYFDPIILLPFLGALALTAVRCHHL